MKNKVLTKLIGAATIIIVLVVGIQIGSKINQGRVSLGAPVPPSPTRDKITPSPTQTSTAKATETLLTAFSVSQIPMCTFDQRVVSPMAESMLEAYVFSEPQVVLTHTVAIKIVEWLPDNQRLLIKRQISDQTSREYIEVFDTQTGEIQRYGETRYSGAEPIWLQAEQAVAYIDFTPDDQRTLYISRGEQAIENVDSNVIGRHLARMANGRQVIYFDATTRGQPQMFDLVQTRKASFRTDLRLPAIEATLPDYRAQYRIAVHPNETQIAFYNNSAFYLSDIASGQVCEIDLGMHSGRKQWALSAHWSPDGRYLAAFVVIGKPIVPFIHLTLVDMLTGEQHLIDMNNDHLYALAWAPSSRDFLLLGQDPETEHRHELYLVDAVTGNTRLVLENYPFMYTAFHGVVWSSTGQTIALSCPIIDSMNSKVTQRQLCIITVGVKQ